MKNIFTASVFHGRNLGERLFINSVFQATGSVTTAKTKLHLTLKAIKNSGWMDGWKNRDSQIPFTDS